MFVAVLRAVCSFSLFGRATVCFIDVGIVIFYSVPGNSRRCLRKSRRNPYIGLMVATAEVGMKLYVRNIFYELITKQRVAAGRVVGRRSGGRREVS